jgi:multiple sugar transport system ATP-binding protein
MTLADKIVVLDHGVISQIGAPMDLYLSPENKFVASFIGSPTMNFVPADLKQVDGSTAALDLKGGGHVTVTTRKGPAKKNGGLELGIRPEHVGLGAAGAANINLPGTIQIVEHLGNATIMYVDTPAGTIVVQDDGDYKGKAGENVGIIFDPTRCHVFASNGMVM